MEQGLRGGNVVAGMYPDVALLLREEGFPVESKFPKGVLSEVGYYACPQPLLLRFGREVY